jgi:hypothetical protein
MLPKGECPQEPREGHKCEPSYEDLKRMSKQELTSLKEFKIYHDQFGSIEFKPFFENARIDLTHVDLAAFEICYGTVSGYDEDEGGQKKPELNTKLNIPAVVTLKLAKDVKESKLEKIIERRNGEDTRKENGEAAHIAYADREWIFRVPHWSRYGLDDSDEEDEETKEIEPEDLKKKAAQKVSMVEQETSEKMQEDFE